MKNEKKRTMKALTKSDNNQPMMTKSRFLGKEYEKHLDFWEGKLRATEGSFHPGRKHLATENIDGRQTVTARYTLTPEASAVMEKISSGQPLGRFVLFTAAFHWLLARLDGYMGEDSYAVVTETPLVRSKQAIETNDRVSLITKVKGTDTVKDWITHIKETVVNSYKYQALPVDLVFPEHSTFTTQPSSVSLTYKGLHQPVSRAHAYDLMAQVAHEDGETTLSFEWDATWALGTFMPAVLRYTDHLIAGMGETGRALNELSFAPEEQTLKALQSLNKTSRPYPEEKDLITLFEETAEAHSDRLALSDHMSSYTYGRLNERVNRLAHALLAHGVGKGDAVGFSLERSADQVIVLLAILKAGAYYVCLDTKWPAERTQYVVGTCAIKVIFGEPAGEPVAGVTYLSPHPVEELAISNPTVSRAPSDTAYIIFTSGSTGEPKGVIIDHKAVVRLVKNTDYTQVQAGEKVLGLSSITFDGSVFDIFAPLLNGGCMVMASREQMLDFEKLSTLLVSEDISVLFITTALFNALVDHDASSFNSVRKVLVGGEKSSVKHIRRFCEVNGADKLVHVYGPTENTVYSTFYQVDEVPEGITSIPIGKPIANSEAYILDSALRPVPPGIPGELFLGGDGLAKGYLGDDELTNRKFIDNPLRAGDKLYRSGDKARYLHDGSIDFISRIDFQVKIRGFRIEPGEIDAVLLHLPEVREAAVLVQQDPNGQPQLVAYYSADLSVDEIKEYLQEKLPEYMVPAYFCKLDQMPLNASGKIDRRALPGIEELAGSRYVAPETETEKELAAIWAELLGFEKVGREDHFFEIGGHSILATKAISRIQKARGVKLSLPEFFKSPVLKDQAVLVENGTKGELDTIPLTTEAAYYPLSYAQRRLWILGQFEEEQNAYNIPVAFSVKGRLDKDTLQKAFTTWVNRHESLRTIFITVEGEPRQMVTAAVQNAAEYIDLSYLHEAEATDKARDIYVEDANAPFDLENGPLYRFKIIRIAEGHYAVTVNIHHIISDGWSQGVMRNELVRLYNAFLAEEAMPLEPLALQYKDYSAWHNALEARGHFEKEEAYWLQKMGDKPNGIELPLDYARPSIQTFNGGRVSLTIDQERANALKKLGNGEGSTLFISMLSLIGVLMHKYSRQEDILIGAPIAGRRQPELYDMVGFLVNTLVYRFNVKGDLPFADLVAAVGQEALESYEHQDYPFDLLIEKLGLDRDLSQSPLFNVMIAHNNTDTRDKGLTMSGVDTDVFGTDGYNMSKFDLIFFVIQGQGEVYIDIEYNSDIFRRETIEGMGTNLLHLMDAVIAAPGQAVQHLPNLADAEKQQVTEGFNQTARDYPELTIQEMFQQQVAKTPDQVAVVGEGETITYRELNEQANRLAHYLRVEHGMKPGKVAGISVSRSIDMVISIIAVIKSGAAYVAIDPAWPADRVSHMLRDSQTGVLLTDDYREELLSGFTGKLLMTDEAKKEAANFSVENPPVLNELSDILYVIYTSGSTGTPNGAMLTHDILRNLIQWQHADTSIDGSMRCLQFTSINFCVSFQETFSTLTAGGELYLIDETKRQDIDYLMDFLSRNRIEVLYLPFSYLNFLFNESNRWAGDFRHSLKHIITAGEQLKVTAGLKNFMDSNPELKLHNHYGSSEMHVVTSFTMDAETADKMPIPPAGKPIANTAIYILDENRQPVPRGVFGEICVKGCSEIGGYINNQELTDKKLYDHPELSDGVRLYCSGDLGRWLPGGLLEMKGRKDSQIKIRGFRVEPGEVESKLFALQEVKDCVVEVKQDSQGNKHLVAYLVLENITPFEVKTRISAYLPQYMIPRMVTLDALPLMPNGKVDRAALPEPSEEEVNTPYVAPNSEIEEGLAAIWSEILRVEKIGVNDNFFELGGHSLKATQIVGRITKRWQVKIELINLFTSPTIAQLATMIEDKMQPAASTVHDGEEHDDFMKSMFEL